MSEQLSPAAVARLQDVVQRPDLDSGRYRVLERLGSGGMGVVYRARDEELGRDVAIKILLTPQASPDEQRRILREARILASLEHPGIVPVHDVGTLGDGRLFYVMKLVKGAPLDVHVRTVPSLAERLRIFRQICDAVGFAHEAGVVHHDLKPQNVMVGAYGEVLVVDWGVATVGANAPGSSAQATALGEPQPGAVVGTPGYMAPEQRVGDGREVDARSDVFGLGGILLFLLTDAHPPLAGPPRWPPHAPAVLRSIANRARAPIAAQRYQAAKELAADLEAYADRRPVRAHRETPREWLARVARRHQTAILLVTGYLIMRVALLVLRRG